MVPCHGGATNKPPFEMGVANLSRSILRYIFNNGKTGRSEFETVMKKSGRTINDRLSKLIRDGLLVSNGNKYDSGRTYELDRK